MMICIMNKYFINITELILFYKINFFTFLTNFLYVQTLSNYF